MHRVLLLILVAVFAASIDAASFRCQRKIIRVGDSSNTLISKCGTPVRKYSAKHVVTEHGKAKQVGVSNWVYQRRGKKDMVIAVRNGIVISIRTD